MKRVLVFLLTVFLVAGQSLASRVVRGKVEKVDYKNFRAVLIVGQSEKLSFSFGPKTKFFYRGKAKNLRWAKSNFLPGSEVEVVLKDEKALEIRVLFVPQ